VSQRSVVAEVSECRFRMAPAVPVLGCSHLPGSRRPTWSAPSARDRGGARVSASGRRGRYLEARDLPLTASLVRDARPCENPGSTRRSAPATLRALCDENSGAPLRLTHGVRHRDGIELAPRSECSQLHSRAKYKAAIKQPLVVVVPDGTYARYPPRPATSKPCILVGVRHVRARRVLRGCDPLKAV
jgi:hypothetical protein